VNENLSDKSFEDDNENEFGSKPTPDMKNILGYLN
jgi:hypothetical protein